MISLIHQYDGGGGGGGGDDATGFNAAPFFAPGVMKHRSESVARRLPSPQLAAGVCSSRASLARTCGSMRTTSQTFRAGALGLADLLSRCYADLAAASAATRFP